MTSIWKVSFYAYRGVSTHERVLYFDGERAAQSFAGKIEKIVKPVKVTRLSVFDDAEIAFGELSND